MTAFSPLMLTIAREAAQLSQSALAKQSLVSQAALSQMEAGLIATPSDVVLDKLSEHLKVPTSLFFVPLRYQNLPVTFFRKKARLGVRDVNGIRARVNLFRLRLEFLLRANEPTDVRVTLTDLAKHKSTPEVAAQRLRMFWNVPPGPIKDVTKLVEDHGVVVVPFDFGTADVDGLSIYEPNDTLPPMIFLNAKLPPDRWRMTLIHELGHIVQHHHLNIPPDEKDMEHEGFAFAQEFLMPAREVSGSLTYLNMSRLAQLKVHWRVSMRAILMRARALGKLSEKQTRGMFINLSRQGQAESVQIDAESPTTIRRLVDKHLNELEYTQLKLSQAMHQQLDQFRSDFGIAAPHLRLA